uniref:Reverse transcriptase domain-containing protein n=1 Tax=Anguilla anguilla TaxID=7936 RepID=A0A0E9U108_ANGAN
MAADAGDISVLLHLNAAFDTIDHAILNSRLTE